MRSFLQLVLLLPTASHAGDHRPLCQKVEIATAVVEMHFEQHATWSKTVRDKGWPPPAVELHKTLVTGHVVQVFKGELEVGATWQESWGQNFTISGLADWGVFMAQTEFRQIWFMDGAGGSTGWAEEAAGCGSSEQDSWCEGYANFKAQIEACLSPPVPDPDPPDPDPEPPSTETAPAEDPLAD